ncbi:hypothetical protein [Pseudorhizobium flavum]|uniref:hypothetical protein n=1 Tax=Pseudorhizobium flavum TaxID=1335061 RepID=UPI0024925F7D|nr:hypothetical protein [Pseudorhizobium flavum]
MRTSDHPKNPRAVHLAPTLLRMTLAALLLVGPLAAVTIHAKADGLAPKQGAGFVLFVSLQRQSMS